ncbi:MAG: Dephospho-CoA kinase [Alphaproteobacteria bacterium MarineAlpha9_Bin5]|nr:MAG: Dephospho-CoA kinase [Alphaproteobacteria bacterium MarineAlpha9_Bin6]PPR38134.1 MAG: Dephospho-CoA kinase [Alphaproteobacteria bacterium MarineAlpha9_Bin5]
MVRSGPLILGLTGSIAMGKSEAAGMFRRLRVPVFDSDAEVHRLLGQNGPAVGPVSAAFPGVMRAGAIDRQALGEDVFANDSKLCILEEILHPLVRRARRRFLRKAGAARASVVVVDVPLLFETGGELRCDAVVVVSAPGFVQRQRAMARPSMSADKLEAILARQTPDRVKRQRADFVVSTGIGKRTTLLAIDKILKIITGDALCRHRSRSRRRALARSCS